MAEEKTREASFVNAPQSDKHRHSEQIVNASGHVQELERNFSLISLASVGLVVGCVWPAVGGSILVALYNGGPPGMSRLVP